MPCEMSGPNTHKETTALKFQQLKSPVFSSCLTNYLYLVSLCYLLTFVMLVYSIYCIVV